MKCGRKYRFILQQLNTTWISHLGKVTECISALNSGLKINTLSNVTAGNHTHCPSPGSSLHRLMSKICERFSSNRAAVTIVVLAKAGFCRRRAS